MVILGVMSGRAAVSADGGAPTVRFRSHFAAANVERALAGARRRLEQPGCRRLLSEFHDQRGRPLGDALGAEGRHGSDYLARLLFYDGEGQPQCRRQATLAFTRPGSPVILLCGRFLKVSRVDPELAEAVLIHEALHSLGLGENPPTSAEITARVLNRCQN
jgi:hypothetical protein